MAASNENKDQTTDSRNWLVPAEGRVQLEKFYASLPQSVVLEVYTDGDEKSVVNDYATRLAGDLAALAPRIEARFYLLGSEEAKQRHVELGPTILINPDEYNIRFTGAPLGEEARAFIESILLVGRRSSGLSEASLVTLANLTEPRHPRVFSSPGCPYCPAQCVSAVRCAIEKPELITAECINADEFPELSQQFGVGSVPHTQFGVSHKAVGLMPEERFVLELVALKDANEVLREKSGAAGVAAGPAGSTSGAGGLPVETYDVVVLGAGPAGLAAGIYLERSGLKTVVVDRSVLGGQIVATPTVENYPGFDEITGLQLVEVLAAHARQYTIINENEYVENIKIGREIEVHTLRRIYMARALIFATGAQWRKLEVPGEKRFYGKGVSYCATCDGYSYRKRKVLIIGGGNTAATDALHLHHLGVDVTMVHRRDSLRAEQALQNSLKSEQVPVIWNSEVVEIMGDTEVRGVRLRDTVTGKTSEVACDGVFVAIGYVPNSEQAAEIGVTLEPDGCIAVDKFMRTNIPRVYAAGDVIGGIRQIATAVGTGTTAALTAFEDLQNPRWKRDKPAQPEADKS